MQIEVNLKVDEANFATASTVAYGWVTLENLIRFPVKVRKYFDKDEGKEKLFVSYPQKKTGKGYEYVCIPTDPQVRKEVDEKVLLKVRETILKPMEKLPIDKVRVTLLKPNGEAAVKNVAIATIETAGVTISGIVLKEGRNGLFLQMPQHISEGKYTDTVYPVTSAMNRAMKDAIINEYLKELQKQQEKLQEQRPDPVKTNPQEPEQPYDLFLEKYAASDIAGMIEAAEKSNVEITQTGVSEDGTTIEFQEAVIRKEGQPPITLVFGNDYNPSAREREKQRTIQLFAFVPQENDRRIVSLIEVQGQNQQELKEGYERVISHWNRIVSHKELKPAKTPEQPHPVRPNALMTQPRR